LSFTQPNIDPKPFDFFFIRLKDLHIQ